MIGLGVVGAGALVMGKLEDDEMVKQHNAYLADSSATQATINSTWNKAQSAQTLRNVYYGLGATLLAAGITVQFAF